MIEPLSEGTSFWGILGGILIQILLIMLFLSIALIKSYKKDFWLIMYLPLILGRIVPNIFFVITSSIYNKNIFIYNDEGYIARLLNIPLTTSCIFIAMIFILFWIILRFKLNKSYFYKLNLKISLCITLLAIFSINVI